MRGTPKGLLNIFARGWVISRLLLHPPDKPLFKRLLTQPKIATYYVWIPLLLSTVACCGLWSVFLLLNGSIDGLVFTTFFAISTGTFVSWASGIATSLVGERENGTYDLLSVMPDGAQGVDWAICLANLHKDGKVLRLYDMRLLITLAIGFTAMVALFKPSTANPALFIVLLLLGLFAYLDQVQAIVLAGLVGMIVPYYARNGLDARMWAIGAFLLSQTLLFLSAIWLDRVFSTSQRGSSAGLLAGMLIIYAGREVIIRWLWRQLSLKWNSRTVEP